MDRATSAAPRLADVVCRAGHRLGQSLVLAVPPPTARKFAGSDCLARNQSLSAQAASLRKGVALRLSLFHPRRKKGDRRMVGPRAPRNLFPRSSPQMIGAIVPLPSREGVRG